MLSSLLYEGSGVSIRNDVVLYKQLVVPVLD